MTANEIYQHSIDEVDIWLNKEMYMPVNLFRIETDEDLQKAGQLIIVLSNKYTYLSSVFASLKYMQRREKDCKNKVKSDELIDKRELVRCCMEAIGKMRDSVSRLITIRKMEMEELKSLNLL